MEISHLFRRLVFAQVLLGIVAFCMAEVNPGLLLIAGAICLLSWYIVEGPTGRPLPIWAIHVGAIVAVGWLVLEIARWRNTGHGTTEKDITTGMIIAMGHFTMWLQILQLFGRKGNREYALILVLGLMQMIGASVLNPSVVFGILLAVYCVMGLITILVFQFKAQSDLVFASIQAQAPRPQRMKRPTPIVGRGASWQLRLAGLIIGATCILTATVVFVFAPRRPDAPLSAGLLASQQQTVGFSENVRLRGGPINAQSEKTVMKVSVKENGEPVGAESLGFLLRGAALDEYNPATQSWRRSESVRIHDQQLSHPEHGAILARMPVDTPLREIEITTLDTPVGILFSTYPPTQMAADHPKHILFNPIDQRLHFHQIKSASTRIYTVSSPLNSADVDFDERYREQFPLRVPRSRHWGEFPMSERRHRRFLAIDEIGAGWQINVDRFRTLAQSILDDHGLERDVNVAETPDDEKIVEAIKRHLQRPGEFSYSLENPAGSDVEPLTGFLFEHKEGHCELFASALAALVRSIGMRARVATGYRVSEYSEIGGYFVVRQKNAHAWTEVHLPDRGWVPFDPTPPGDLEAIHQPSQSWLAGIRAFYEHVEFAWLSSFVAYDQRKQASLINDVKTSVDAAVNDESHWLGRILTFVEKIPQVWRLDRVAYAMIAVVTLAICIGIFSLAQTIVIRRRRISALNLQTMPARQRKSMTKRLRFYLIMMDMLDRHGFLRPTWQSPATFAQTLLEKDERVFDPVVRLTDLFYEIRFGDRPIDDDRRDRIRLHLGQLEKQLSGVYANQNPSDEAAGQPLTH